MAMASSSGLQQRLLQRQLTSLPRFNGLRCRQSIKTVELTSLQRQRLRTQSTVRRPLAARAAAAGVATSPAENQESELTLTGQIFGGQREFTATESIARSLPGPIMKAARAALVVAGVGAGYLAGGRVVREPAIAGQVAGAVVLGALGGAAGVALLKASVGAAATELHNFMCMLPDPRYLQRSQVQGIADTYGVSMEDDRMRAELKDIYERFVWAVLPPGNDSLRGNEADVISAFKESLGLEDEDAAGTHIELGRRIFRQRMETGDKDQAIEERKTFQKLVYVSELMFGPKAKFLLPWKRLFKVTDSQVEVAVRANAQELFQTALDKSNAEADLSTLQELRQKQLKYKLTDDLAAELFEAQARKRLEQFSEEALLVLKARTRVKDTRRIINALNQMRAYHRALMVTAASAPPGQLVPGVGGVTLLVDNTGEKRTMEDLRTLYKTYLQDALDKSERLEKEQLTALGELRNIFGMGRKEAEAASEEVTKKAYRKRLAQAVTSGALEGAPSKAEFLQNLCDALNFDPEAAAIIHEDIYRQKLQQCLEDGALSDEDVSALLRLRVLLCIPKAVEEKAHGDICGGIFTKVVDDAIGAGLDGYDGDMRTAVQKAVKGLRLPVQAAIEIASKAVRAIFLTYVRRARSSMSRTESARELKKMVIFSNLTVSQLLSDIKGESTEEEKKVEEVPEVVEEDDEELDLDDRIPMIQSMKKTRGKQREGKAQKEINIKDELEVRERKDLYRTFLLFCIQGDTTGMPMGSQLVVQKDESEFLRLGQLGDILGLTPLECAEVHQGLAEQAFTNQAQTLLADGQLSKTRAEQLKQMQQQLGLPDAAAQKVIQNISSTKMAGAIDQAVQQGRLTVEDIRGLKESGVSIDKMVAKKVREQMFQKLVGKELDKGTGVFDADMVLSLPEDLGLEEAQAKVMLRDIAKERLSGSLVQAVSLLRQKKPKEAVATMYNMLACDTAERAEEALTWPVKEELWDLYALFLNEKEKAGAPNGDAVTEGREARLKELLGIDDRTATTLQEMVTSGGFSLDGAQEEKFVF